MNAVRAELRKIRSTRTLMAAPAVAVAFAVLAFGPVLALDSGGRARELDPSLLIDVARGPGVQVAVAMLLMGALATAGEFRHGTIAATLLVTPRRRDLVRAKALAVAIVALVTTLVVEVVALSIGTAYVRAHDLASTASVADIALTAGGVAVAAVLYGLAGVGLGLALRDQTAAVALALAWVGIAEGVVPVVLRRPWLFRWLPGGAVDSLLSVADPPGDLLPAWAGALMLVAVAAALLSAAAASFTTRDVA